MKKAKYLIFDRLEKEIVLKGGNTEKQEVYLPAIS